jgi:hypothetical protein
VYPELSGFIAAGRNDPTVACTADDNGFTAQRLSIRRSTETKKVSKSRCNMERSMFLQVCFRGVYSLFERH